jgi:hypothetical protein
MLGPSATDILFTDYATTPRATQARARVATPPIIVGLPPGIKANARARYRRAS